MSVQLSNDVRKSLDHIVSLLTQEQTIRAGDEEYNRMSDSIKDEIEEIFANTISKLRIKPSDGIRLKAIRSTYLQSSIRTYIARHCTPAQSPAAAAHLQLGPAAAAPLAQPPAAVDPFATVYAKESDIQDLFVADVEGAASPAALPQRPVRRSSPAQGPAAAATVSVGGDDFSPLEIMKTALGAIVRGDASPGKILMIQYGKLPESICQKLDESIAKIERSLTKGQGGPVASETLAKAMHAYVISQDKDYGVTLESVLEALKNPAQKQPKAQKAPNVPQQRQAIPHPSIPQRIVVVVERSSSCSDVAVIALVAAVSAAVTAYFVGGRMSL